MSFFFPFHFRSCYNVRLVTKNCPFSFVFGIRLEADFRVTVKDINAKESHSPRSLGAQPHKIYEKQCTIAI